MSDPADLLRVPAVRQTLAAFLREDRREDRDPAGTAYGTALDRLTAAVREASPQPDYLTWLAWRSATLDDVDQLVALADERDWTGD